MCGIIGAVVKDNLWKLDVKNYITQGLMASSVRGEDGTGVFVVTDKGEVQIYKKPYPSWDYLQLPKYTELLEQDIRFIVGHTRASTRGYNSYLHTHPFQFEHITLVHNGTLLSYANLCTPQVNHDSMAIAMGMVENGEIETLEQLDGAFTLVWYNAKTEKLNIARNRERPLSLGVVIKGVADKKKRKQKESNDILFASESSMLVWLAERNKLNVTHTANYSEYTMISYPLDKNGNIETRKFKEKVTKTSNAVAWGCHYKPIMEGEEFAAQYLGEYKSWIGGVDRVNHKFKIDGDSNYAWIVDEVLKDKNMELIENKYYKLSALESRNSSTDMQNKEAMVLEAMPVSNILILPDKHKPLNALLAADDPATYYRDGSEIEFIITNLCSNNSMNQYIEGVTTDTNDVQVRCYVNAIQGYAVEDIYKGVIELVAKRPGKPGYLVVGRMSLRFQAKKICSSCAGTITPTELEFNRLDNRAYCDLCYRAVNYLDA